MRVQNSLQDPCPICGKDITLAVIEPHPTHPERELHTYRCVDCGPVSLSGWGVKPVEFPAGERPDPMQLWTRVGGPLPHECWRAGCQ